MLINTMSLSENEIVHRNAISPIGKISARDKKIKPIASVLEILKFQFNLALPPQRLHPYSMTILFDV